MKTFRRSTFQVALACALGALVCGVVAIKTGYNITFGIIAGLIVGYVTYDFRSVLKAIPVAFADLFQWMDEKRLDLVEFKSALTPSAVVSLAIAASSDLSRFKKPSQGMRGPLHSSGSSSSSPPSC